MMPLKREVFNYSNAARPSQPSRLAYWSLALGILAFVAAGLIAGTGVLSSVYHSWYILLALVAFVYSWVPIAIVGAFSICIGVTSLAEMRMTRTYGGRGSAWLGIILSLLANAMTGGCGLYLHSLDHSATSPAAMAAKAQEGAGAEDEMRNLLLYCETYEYRHPGHLPPDFNSLRIDFAYNSGDQAEIQRLAPLFDYYGDGMMVPEIPTGPWDAKAADDGENLVIAVRKAPLSDGGYIIGVRGYNPVIGVRRVTSAERSIKLRKINETRSRYGLAPLPPQAFGLTSTVTTQMNKSGRDE